MAVVVCGLDDVALRVVEQLHAAGERVVVVDEGFDPRLGRALDALGVSVHAGRPQRRQVLADAGLDDAEAVICADRDDLLNLEVALLVHQQWPQVRLVVALTNRTVGRAIAQVVPNATVLDVASLAAPSFVEAAAGLTTHAIDLDGTAFALQQQAVATDGTIRSHFGDLAPIAVVHADGDMAVCPGRDLAVRAGDVVSLLGPAPEVGDDRDTEGARTWQRSHRVDRLLAWPRLLWQVGDRPLKLALLAIVLVELVSVLVLVTSYRGGRGHMNALDAVYFTTETITGVGFGDFSFSEQQAWLRIWAILLMLVGAAAVTLVYAFLTNVLVSRRIEESRGRRTVTGLRDHVVVVGLGAVGSSVVAGLRAAGRDVVVLDADEDNPRLARVRDLRVPVVVGDATLDQTLQAVNVTTAGAVAVVTGQDLVNIETALAVQGLAPHVPVVTRVFDRQLATTVADAFGFARTRSTAALAAPWFVGAALGLRVLNTFYVERQPFLVGRLDIPPAGGLVGHAMGELGARIRVVAIRRSGRAALEFPPRRDTRFSPGDATFVVGPYEELLTVLRRNRAVVAS